MQQLPTDVTVCFANYNTAQVSELCLRSMHVYAGHPFQLLVGDCDSTDGSIAMFERYERSGRCTLEIARGGRRHGDWLDQWLATVTTKYVVFCDSDVEFLRHNWLHEMVRTAELHSAALVATRIQAKDGVAYTHPGTGAVATLAARPEPWLMLFDAEQVRSLPASFLYEEQTVPHGGKVAYDTAAAFFREIVSAGLVYVEMPSTFARSFRHYSGMTWQRSGVPLRRQLKQIAKRTFVGIRWARSRIMHQRALRSIP